MLKNKKNCEDSLAEKTVGELSEKQKDLLIQSFIRALDKLSSGGKYFLILMGAAAGLASVYLFLEYVKLH